MTPRAIRSQEDQNSQLMIFGNILQGHRIAIDTYTLKMVSLITSGSKNRLKIALLKGED
jgi:hypothetical protein